MHEALTNILSPLLAAYHAEYDLADVPIKVDSLRPLIQDRGFVDRIIWEDVDYEGETVIAKVEFYRASMGVYAGTGDYARVQYSRSLNFCWRRFAVAKEMFHCLLDGTPEDRVTSAEDAFKVGHLLMSDLYASVEEFQPHETEEVAEVLALEALFPIELRCRHKDDYDAGIITDYQLALRYRIPEEYVSLAMENGYYSLIYDTRVNSFVTV